MTRIKKYKVPDRKLSAEEIAMMLFFLFVLVCITGFIIGHILRGVLG